MKTIPFILTDTATVVVAKGLYSTNQLNDRRLFPSLGRSQSTVSSFKNSREVRQPPEVLQLAGEYPTAEEAEHEKPSGSSDELISLGIMCPRCHQTFDVVASRISQQKPFLKRKLFRYFHCRVCDYRFREINGERFSGIFLGILILAISGWLVVALR